MGLCDYLLSVANQALQIKREDSSVRLAGPAQFVRSYEKLELSSSSRSSDRNTCEYVNRKGGWARCARSSCQEVLDRTTLNFPKC